MTDAQRRTLEVVEHLASLDLGDVDATMSNGFVHAHVMATSSPWDHDGEGFTLVIDPNGGVRLS